MYISCLLSVFFVSLVSAFPWENGYNEVPQRVVMMSGYYGTPVFGRSQQYTPQGSISAFVNKDTVATNTYAGEPLNVPGGELPLEEQASGEAYPQKTDAQEFPVHDTEEQSPEIEQHHVASLEETASSSANEGSTDGTTALVTSPPKRVARKKKVQKPVSPQAEEEEEDEQPNRREYVPSNNVFFPITISGAGGARSRARNAPEGQQEDEFFAPGAATAIANSYSTGRGGIATSHATSFGDPYLASMLYRSGFFNYNKAKKGQIEA